jgi:hypothetical protein
MKEKPRKPAEYWQAVIKDFLGSGLTQKAYAQEHNICRATLLTWGKRLGIPLRQRGDTSSKNQGIPTLQKESQLSFIEVNTSQLFAAPSSVVKCEVAFSQGTTLKLEAVATWEQIGCFIKTLMV